jgi:hypothetical protein
MNHKAQLACAWTGVIATLVMFFAMWALMRFLPPLAPSLSAAELAAIYRANSAGIIVGGILLMLAASIYMPFFAALALQLKRMERPSTLWTYSMLTSALLGFVPLLVAELLFSTAAYRSERSDELIGLLSDLGFILFVGPALPGTVQMLSVAFAVLADRNPEPVFPRWVGFFNIWTAVLTVPGCLVTLFKGGPFAWNGVLAFWVAAFAFGVWVAVCFWAMRRAILRELRAAGG